MDAETTRTIIAAVIGPGGVVLGWWLGGKTARRSARDEREWQERQTIRQRQEQAAERLHEQISEAVRDMSWGTVPAEGIRDKLPEIHRRVLRACAGSTVQAEKGIRERIRRLDMLLFIADGDASATRTLRPPGAGRGWSWRPGTRASTFGRSTSPPGIY